MLWFHCGRRALHCFLLLEFESATRRARLGRWRQRPDDGRGIGIGSGGSGGTGIVGHPNDGGMPSLDGKITPDGSTITVTGQPMDVVFHFKLSDGSEPRVVWAVDD